METPCALSFGGESIATTCVDWQLPHSIVQTIEMGIKAARKNPRTDVPPFTAAVRSKAAKHSPDDPWVSAGLVQYQLPATALATLQASVDQWLPVTASASIAQAKQALHQHFRLAQIDLSPDSKKIAEAEREAKPMTRAKIFWARYGYGETECEHGLCSPAPLQNAGPCPSCGHKPDVDAACCDDMPIGVRAVAQALMDATVDTQPLCKLSSINSALLNIYEKKAGPTSMLGQHFDSPHHFSRPIYTIRLLRPATLSFVTGGLMTAYGASGQPRIDFPIYFQIPLLPGCLTEMSGFSASALLHAVLPGSESGRTVSLVLRNIHDSLLSASSPMWLARNKIARTTAVARPSTQARADQDEVPEGKRRRK